MTVDIIIDFIKYWFEVSNFIALYLIAFVCIASIIKFNPKVKSWIDKFEFTKKINIETLDDVFGREDTLDYFAWVHYGCFLFNLSIVLLGYFLTSFEFFSPWDAFVGGTCFGSLIFSIGAFFTILFWLIGKFHENILMIQDACFTPVTSNMELPIDSKNSFLSKRLNSPRLNKIRYFIYNHPTRFGMEALPEDGKAKYIFKNGAWYEGEWKNGKRNGSGTLTNLKNRDSSGSYSGEWKDDLMHGKGILSPEVLMWIDGNFENGVIDEENITIFSGIYENEGRKFIGKTKNFEMWEGTLFDNEGNVISKFVNGKEEK